MESIALGYLNIDQETIDSLKVQHRDNTEAFNREIIRIWAYKNSETDQTKVGDYAIPFLRRLIFDKNITFVRVSEQLFPLNACSGWPPSCTKLEHSMDM